MTESWIQLQCPSCSAKWSDNPTSLPAPDTEFQCSHCGERRPFSEFTRTARDLEILREFH